MSKKKTDIFEERRKNTDLTTLAQTLLPCVKKLLGPKGFLEIDILSAWEQIVGAELAAYSFPQRLDFKKGEKTGGILHIAVPSGAFALELQHREPQLVAKINTYFGYAAVKEIRLSQSLPLPAASPKRSWPDNPQKTLVTKEEDAYIRDLSQDVQNEELRKTLEKLGQSIFSHNKEVRKLEDDEV